MTCQLEMPSLYILYRSLAHRDPNTLVIKVKVGLMEGRRYSITHTSPRVINSCLERSYYCLKNFIPFFSVWRKNAC